MRQFYCCSLFKHPICYYMRQFSLVHVLTNDDECCFLQAEVIKKSVWVIDANINYFLCVYGCSSFSWGWRSTKVEKVVRLKLLLLVKNILKSYKCSDFERKYSAKYREKLYFELKKSIKDIFVLTICWNVKKPSIKQIINTVINIFTPV